MEGVGLRDERGLLEALGKALRFPGYFGGNWDAFTDCMGDIANEGVPLALLWIDADTFLSRDLHSFVRAVHALLSVARDLDTVEDGFQFEIFFVAVHEAFRSAPAMTPPESPRSP
jgi:RNAse (barnase) inhibitor barstar